MDSVQHCKKTSQVNLGGQDYDSAGNPGAWFDRDKAEDAREQYRKQREQMEADKAETDPPVCLRLRVLILFCRMDPVVYCLVHVPHPVDSNPLSDAAISTIAVESVLLFAMISSIEPPNPLNLA